MRLELQLWYLAMYRADHTGEAQQSGLCKYILLQVSLPVYWPYSDQTEDLATHKIINCIAPSIPALY